MLLNEDYVNYLGERPVILCIGSDRVTGDCLGPLVGELLLAFDVNAYVYGSLSFPVTALNINHVVAAIKLKHSGSKILAIDSSVGKKEDVGKLSIIKGSLKPGSADGKKLPPVGDVAITATVTDSSLLPLSSVRLGDVYRLARKIAGSVLKVYPPRNLHLNYNTLY